MLAEGVRLELTSPVKGLRFSRPVHSTARPPLQYHLILPDTAWPCVACGACVAANMCSQGEIYRDKLRNEIGAANFAIAYSRTQQFQDALACGDISALQQFVQLKGPP